MVYMPPCFIFKNFRINNSKLPLQFGSFSAFPVLFGSNERLRIPCRIGNTNGQGNKTANQCYGPDKYNRRGHRK